MKMRAKEIPRSNALRFGDNQDAAAQRATTSSNRDSEDYGLAGRFAVDSAQSNNKKW